MTILILYGLPGTGKTSVINNMKNYFSISIDCLIREKKLTPTIADFKELSDELMDEIIAFVVSHRYLDIGIELGCLVPIKSIKILEKKLIINNLPYINVILTAENKELVNRLKKRNNDIELGLSDAIKVDSPEKLARFIEIFSFNKPSNALFIDTTNKEISSILKEIELIIVSFKKNRSFLS